jgi:hypothetical protein
MKTIIKLNVKSLWKLPKGHPQHRSGSGCHAQGVKRCRTRANQNRQAVKYAS